jgi:hypothetical protein
VFVAKKSHISLRMVPCSQKIVCLFTLHLPFTNSHTSPTQQPYLDYQLADLHIIERPDAVDMIWPPLQHILSPIFGGFCELSAAMARQRSTNYLAGRRVFAPFDQEIPNPGSMGKACGGHEFSWSNTRVDPTRVGGGQFFLPGSPGTNLHTISWVLL